MRSEVNINRISKDYRLLLCSMLFLFLAQGILKAQGGPEDPPRPVTITATAQGLSFGAFYHYSSGGTVIITPAGARSRTGDVVLFGLNPFSAALFNVRGNPGTVVSLMSIPDVTLNGSNGGSMILQINVSVASNPPQPFVLTLPYPTPTPLSIGGTLIVSGSSSANPPGSYSGTFNITLIQE